MPYLENVSNIFEVYFRSSPACFWLWDSSEAQFEHAGAVSRHAAQGCARFLALG